jgi:hypothetical protein
MKESTAQQVYKDAVSDPRLMNFPDGSQMTRGAAKENGLVRSLDPGSSQAEEVFRSSLAERIPVFGGIIRRSNRSFTTYGNELRSKVFDTIIDSWERGGKAYTHQDVDSLTDMLNRFTGRGTLGNDNLTKALQVVQWAPQGRVAPLQAIGHLANPNALVRKEAWRNIAADLAAGGSVLTAAHLAGFDVTLDPRSTDFGKIVVGKTHINIWGQGQPLFRSIAQIAAGEKITAAGASGGGNIFTNPMGVASTAQNNVRKETAWKYFRSGLAPEWGTLVDILDGEDILGRDASLRPSNWDEMAWRTFLPLVMSDAAEAFSEYGLGPEVPAAAAYSGIGGSASHYTDYQDTPTGALNGMPRWDGVTKEQERDLYDYLDEVETEYQRARRDGVETTKANVAVVLGQETDRADLGTLAAAQLKGNVPLNWERVQYAVDNQDDIDSKALGFAVPIDVAREYLTEQNFQRYIKARGER